MWGILACALLFGLTMGRTNPAAPVSFFHNLDSASARSLIEAFAGGMIFNLGNLLLVAAISVAGMAVAFPLGAGLALVIGAVLNYVVWFVHMSGKPPRHQASDGPQGNSGSCLGPQSHNCPANDDVSAGKSRYCR
jgi:hypothetical protein